MIREIENRRSIRKYKPDEIERKLIDEIIYSASLAPSAKNRQPWKFIVYQGKEKDKLVDVMRHGINSEKMTHELMPEWAFAIPDAENTVRIMQEVPCLIAVLNTNQHTPFASIENEKRIVEICDSLSIGISDKTRKAESRMMMSYRNHLSLIFPEAIILEVNRKLILFFDTKEVGICLNVLEAFLEKYDLLAVCSNQFHKITDFAYILNQLLMVIGLEKSLHFNKSLIHYQDYIMYCAIKKIGREGHIQYFCMPELLEVFRYDHKYGTSFAYSKRIALELASVTAAAQKLGIHRNTMEYRLRKFNDLSGISNYTADIVERLLFTYKILDLYPEILEEKDIL